MTRVESPQHVEEYNSLHATSDCADVALDRCHDPARPKIATGCVTPGRSICNTPYLTRAEIMDLVWWHIKPSRRLPSIPTASKWISWKSWMRCASVDVSLPCPPRKCTACESDLNTISMHASCFRSSKCAWPRELHVPQKKQQYMLIPTPWSRSLPTDLRRQLESPLASSACDTFVGSEHQL